MTLLNDLRHGLRLLGRSPGFTAVAVLSLALGIGANTAIFSLMDALVLRKLPVEKPEELVHFGLARGAGLTGSFPRRETEIYSTHFYKQVRENRGALQEIAAMSSLQLDSFVRIGRQGELERIKMRIVSGNYFPMLRVGAAAGRVLTNEDDVKPGGHPVMVLSDRFWMRRFGRSPAAIGTTVAYSGTQYTVIGVAAQGFTGTVVGESPDGWIPLAMQVQAQPWITNTNDPLTQFLWLSGRMRPGQTMAQAQAGVDTAFRQWLAEIAGTNPTAERREEMSRARAVLVDAAHGVSSLRRSYQQPLQILAVVVGLVLLIACANIANLLLARVAGRKREIAVRLALGAGRMRLMTQMLTESLLIALMGGALGIVLAWWGGQWLLAMVTSGPEPIPLEVAPNAPVLLFTLVVSIATGLLAGLAPAWRMTRVDAGPALKEGKGAAREAGSSGWLGQAIVAGQVAVALLLLAGAGLFLRTLAKLESVPSGFDRAPVVTIGLDKEATGLRGKARMELAHRIQQRLEALPGVAKVSFTAMRYNNGRWTSRAWPEGVERTRANAAGLDGNTVGEAYFDVMGIVLRQGRTFRAGIDKPKAEKAVVIDETAARKTYPSGSPVGKRLFVGGELRQVIGVVKDVRIEGQRKAPEGVFYLFNDQTENSHEDVVLRLSNASAATAVIGQLRGAIRSVDGNVAIAEIATMAELLERSLNQERLMARLASLFGALALMLASIGLYGVLAYAVSRRTSEIGIRMALGASPASVLRMVLSGSLRMVIVGLVVGLGAAVLCGRLIAAQLYGVEATDPVALGGAAVLLTIIAMAASLIPSRRAAMLDPIRALRDE